jgi:hypothetical protein
MTAVTARADEAPIAGVVKSIDVGAQMFIVEATAKGTRQVTIHVRPTSRVVRFVRSDQGRAASSNRWPPWRISSPAGW